MHHDSTMALAEVSEWLQNSVLCEVLTEQDEWKTTIVISIAPGSMFPYDPMHAKIGVVDPSKMYWEPATEINPDYPSYRGQFHRYPHYRPSYPGEIPEIYLSGRDLATHLRKAPLQG
jgi:hypothetical protein